MNIGERLRNLREKNSLTQEEVGKRIGVTKATVNRYETGEIDIKRTIAIKLSEVFDVSPAYIMGWIDEENPETEDTQPDPDLVVLDAYRLLDTEDKAEIRGEMKHMLKADKYNNTSISGEIAEVLKNIRVSPINIE